MKFQLNGSEIISDAATLDRLLEEQELDGAVVATAVNGQFVPVSMRASQPLENGDLIEVLAPMQGG